MITSFFKPKSGKVTPITSDDSMRSSPAEKRERDGDGEAARSVKRSKPTEGQDPAVVEILAGLEKHNSDDTTWYDVMEKHSNQFSFNALAKFVQQERKSKTIYPPPQDVFSALNLTPLDKVRVVIVGQDPYHAPGQAHGLCFSVRKGIQVPPSLRNMYKELMEDKAVSNFTEKPTHGFLERWAKQGVLMINTVMTVQKGNPNSHQKKGWEEVTDEIIRAVDRRCKKDGRGVVFLLWGKPATTKATTVLGGSASSRHRIICTSHPSPLGATKTKVCVTFGSKCVIKSYISLFHYLFTIHPHSPHSREANVSVEPMNI